MIIAALLAASLARAQSAECAIQPCPAVSADPGTREMWSAVAAAHQSKLQFVDALRDFTRAQAGVVGDEAAALHDSLDAMRRALGGWDRAIGDLETSLVESRRTDDIHLALATAYLDRQRPKDALRELDAAARLNAARVDVYSLQAHAYLLTGNHADAARVLQKAAALAPADPVVVYRLGQEWRSLGRTEDAARALDRFATLASPSAARAVAGLPFERVDLLRQVSEVAPLFPVARYGDGYAALARGDYRAALSLFERAVRDDPIDRIPPRIRQLIAPAAAAIRAGDVAPAIDSLWQVIHNTPAQLEPHRMLGFALLLDGQSDAAIVELTAAMRLDPHNERAHLLLADALLAANRADEAAHELNALLEELPQSGQARYRLAQI